MKILNISVPLVDGAIEAEFPFMVRYYKNGELQALSFETFEDAKEFALMRAEAQEAEPRPPVIDFSPVTWIPKRKVTYEF